MSRRFELTLPDPLWERVEKARGHEPRASFVRRAVEAALVAQPAPPRASAPDVERAKEAAEYVLPKIAPRRR